MVTVAPVSACFVPAFWWAAIVESSRGCLIDFPWKINASLNSIFVFVWYLVNTHANPARWQMFNWCSHMTMLGITQKKKKRMWNQSINLGQKWLIFLCSKNSFFLLGCCQVPRQCTATLTCHKQERHAHQLSNISTKPYLQKLLLNKIKYYAWWPAFPKWQSGWVIFSGREASGCQPVSPQVSPSNELWTSCSGRAGYQPSPPSKPAWHKPWSRWPLAAELACSSDYENGEN